MDTGIGGGGMPTATEFFADAEKLKSDDWKAFASMRGMEGNFFQIVESFFIRFFFNFKIV
jgi:hypothetical protein